MKLICQTILFWHLNALPVMLSFKSAQWTSEVVIAGLDAPRKRPATANPE
jgi:hypothetical protein